MRRAIVLHLRVDALGHAPQRQFAQRDQVALFEEALDGAAGLLGHVDFAFAQPLDQVVGRQVDQLDFVGRSKIASGTVSRTITPVICAMTSLRLSRCWTLSVV